jgi:hypothetical protein
MDTIILASILGALVVAALLVAAIGIGPRVRTLSQPQVRRYIDAHGGRAPRG